MANEKSSSEDAKTVNDSKDSAPEGSREQVAKPNGSKPGLDELRKRAYEIFQAREDLQKAEAALYADASKPDAPKPDGAKADAPKPDASKPDASSVAKPDGSKPSVDEIRKRAFEAFQARHGEPGSALEDWQKAESSLCAEATNASKPEADAPKADAAKADTSKADGAKADAPKANGTKPEAAKADSSQADGPKADAAKADDSKADVAKADAPKADGAKPDAAKADSSKADDSKADASKADAPKADGAKADASKDAVKVPTDTGTIEEAVTKFKSSIKDGLTQEEAAARLKKDGPNAIKEVHINPIMRFLKFLWGPIAWMIEIAAILSAVVRHWEDFVMIFFMLALNAVVGFWEEFKADNEIEALKKHLAMHSNVLRDGKWSEVPAKTLVTGDIVMIKLGNVVPADMKLVDGDYLSIDQSALTGESLPVEKKKNDVAYSGSIVKMGQMNGLVTATGMNTLFGRAAQLTESVKTVSHFQKAVLKIGNFLILTTLGLVALILIVALFRGDPLVETLLFALILTVAAIPVALPAVLSVTMAVGASVLAKMKAIVSRLASIEEMAGMDILCSDKTGTLTKNELKLGSSGRFQGEQRAGPGPGRMFGLASERPGWDRRCRRQRSHRSVGAKGLSNHSFHAVRSGQQANRGRGQTRQSYFQSLKGCAAGDSGSGPSRRGRAQKS